MTKISPFPEAVFVSHDAPTFDTVLAKVRGCERLSRSRKRDLANSVTRMAEIISAGRPLGELPADPEWCRVRIRKVHPAAIGVTPKTWTNLTSNFSKAIEAAGVYEKRFCIQLKGAWAELWIKVRASGDMQLSAGLSRFPRFCQQAGVEPKDVTDDTVAAYSLALQAEELTRAPQKSVYYLIRAWNRAICQIPGWPSRCLTQPDRSRRYSLHWSAFPSELEADVDSWLAMKSSDDIFSLEGPRHALSPATVKLRKGSIQRYASALVHSGIPIESLTNLSVLVQPEIAKQGLKWLITHHGGKIGGGISNIAIAIKMAAKHWVQPGPEVLRQLEGFSRRLNTPERGMTLKNRDRMEVFKDPEMMVALLKLPEKLLLKAAQVKDPKRKAAKVETALAIALLTSCPIRFDNLCNIEPEKNLIRLGPKRRQRLLLQLPWEIVKNDVDLKFEIPPAVATLIDLFTKSHRPDLATVPSHFLFTKRSADAPIGWSTLRTRICKEIRKNLGAELTPHNFRHLAGLIVLSQYPGQYETVRRLLGHRLGSTATDHYVGLETDAAQRVYTNLLSTLKAHNHG